MGEQKSEQWRGLVHRILQARDPLTGSTRERAAIRKGNATATEYYAYPYVLPYLQDNASAAQRTALLRGAALIAEFVDIPALEKDENYQSFGQWCYRVSYAIAADKQNILNPADPDRVGQILAYLHTQNIEEACNSIRRIMQLAAGANTPIPLDYTALLRLLLRWGNGVSESSKEARLRVLRDYYASFSPPR